jgi:hypothetical protein
VGYGLASGKWNVCAKEKVGRNLGVLIWGYLGYSVLRDIRGNEDDAKGNEQSEEQGA